MRSNYTVLIVDDVIFNVQLLQGILENIGLIVLSAQNGPDGRKIAEEAQPDLILLDVMMPGEDGFETCRKLKANAATADIPIIFISALDDQNSKVEGLSIGGWDYICKPFNMAEVQARVKNSLRLQAAFRQVIEDQARRLRQITDAQHAILVDPAAVPDAKFGVHYLPVNEAGGDFYDVFQISDDLFGYFVSDISGHDLGASFATSALKALVRQNSSLLYSADETIRIINKILLSLFADGQHLTAVYAILDKKKMTFSLVNAAHPPILYLPVGSDPVWLPANSDVIGIFAEAVFETRVINVQEGDRFFLYTDGLIEAFSGQRMSREQGQGLLEAAGVATAVAPCQEAVDDIVGRMFADGRQAEDDVLLLGIDVTVLRTKNTPGGLQVILPADFKAIDLVCRKVEGVLIAQGRADALFGITLGCREALTNAVRHGSQGDPQKKVVFELKEIEGKIRIKITDQGRGFDWHKALGHSAGLADETGRGLEILQRYFGKVQFNASGNEVVLWEKGVR